MKENGRIIKSYSYDQCEILNNIIQLYVPSGVLDVDCTYSKGQFYADSSFKVPEPLQKFDLYPQSADVVKADCRNLPIESNSINSLIFDPPFLATTGASLNQDNNNNKINKRFGVYPSEQELHKMYYDSLTEFMRVLKKDGICVVKCQDKISSGKQFMSHVYLINMAEELGFYVEDFFILLAKNRLVADWQLKNQKHSRKYHCYFIVLRKPKNKRKMSYSEIRSCL